MSVIRSKWIMLLLNIALVTFMFLILAPVYDLYHYINQLFYIAYFYLLIGILLYVIRGGFFDGITYSFRRFNNRMAKQKDYMDDWKKKPLPSQMIEGTWMKIFLFNGLMLSGGLLALLVIYYNS